MALSAEAAAEVVAAAGTAAAATAPRGRSGSPTGNRALVADMRRAAKNLGEAGGAMHALGDQANANMSVSSNGSASLGALASTAIATGVRRHTPLGSRSGSQQQVTAILADSMHSKVQGLQQQRDLDYRRLVAMERKLDLVADDRAKESEKLEKLAEVNGSVQGLLQEMQDQARRMDSLEERLWSRTNGAEMVKQRGRELEQHVQVLEQQSRIAGAASEEALKRQATKLCRAERCIEDLGRRCIAIEEEIRSRHNSPLQQDTHLVSRLHRLEQYQTQLAADIQDLQASSSHDQQRWAGVGAAANDEESLRSLEKAASALDKKLSAQMEELSSAVAALKVKVDNQVPRVDKMAKRLEAVHEPVVQSLREELVQARTQDRKEIDKELSALRQKLHEVGNSAEDATAELRGLQRAQVELSNKFASRSLDAELRGWLEDQLGAQELRVSDLGAEVADLHALLEANAGLGKEPNGSEGMQELHSIQSDVAALRSRLGLLEDKTTATGAAASDEIAPKAPHRDYVQQLSRLDQRTSSGEAATATLQTQVQGLLEKVETIVNQESEPVRAANQVSTKVEVLSRQVADHQSRILELEGAAEFAKEKVNTSLFGEAPSAVFPMSEQATPSKEQVRVAGDLPPPLPQFPGSSTPGDASTAAGDGHRSLEDMLEAVASHLEIVDDLADRVSELERIQGIAPKVANDTQDVDGIH